MKNDILSFSVLHLCTSQPKLSFLPKCILVSLHFFNVFTFCFLYFIHWWQQSWLELQLLNCLFREKAVRENNKMENTDYIWLHCSKFSWCKAFPFSCCLSTRMAIMILVIIVIVRVVNMCWNFLSMAYIQRQNFHQTNTNGNFINLRGLNISG
jgi:hypothetical protein